MEVDPAGSPNDQAYELAAIEVLVNSTGMVLYNVPSRVENVAVGKTRTLIVFEEVSSDLPATQSV